MIFDCVFGFEGQGKGWSESHACISSFETPEEVLPTAIAVADKRVTFLGREFSINCVRVSAYSDDGGTMRKKGVASDFKIRTNPIQTAVMAAEPVQVGLIAIGKTGAQLAPPAYIANTSRTTLGAPPDVAVDNAGQVDWGKASLQANVQQWAAALVNGRFGWLLSETAVDLEISSIDQLGNGKIEITTIGNVSPPLAINGVYNARIRQVNGGSSPLNGQLIVRVTAAGTVLTRQPIGIALAQTGGAIRIYRKIKPFARYRAIEFKDVTGNHQRGLPFGATRGRARKRVRG